MSRITPTLLGNPFQGARFTHYLEIDVSGLNVLEGRPGVFVIPNESPFEFGWPDTRLGVELMPRYQKVSWKHELSDEPVILYSEISDQGTETRKVDEYRDGRLGYSDGHRSQGSTFLSEKTMPTLEEIARQPEFAPAAITRDEFEEVWRRATAEA